MKKNILKIIGIILIIIISFVIGEIIGILIGGNFGCFEIIDKIMPGDGYESCGNFGGIVGVIFGAIITLLAYKKSKKK